MHAARCPDFDRLVTTLRNGKADAVPLIELGIHPVVKQSILGRPILTLQDDIAFMHRMGYDFVKIQPAVTLELKRQPMAGHAVPSRTAVDRSWAQEHAGVITSFEDFERYPWPDVADIDYSRLEEARGSLPEGMGVIGQYGDIFTTTWEMMGFEAFAISIYEEPELVEAIFSKVSTLILSMFESMAAMDWVGALWYSDDIAYTSGTMVRPEFLRRHFFPCLKRIGDLARGRGIPLIYHSDGVLWDVMDDILGSGVDALHPIEPKSMDILDVRSRYGDRLSLCGGIDLDLLSRGTPAEVRSLTLKLLHELAPSGGWCAGSSNSIPEYVSTENYRAMVDAILIGDA